MKLPLPELPAFDYLRASSAEKALEQLGNRAARTRVLQGGTDLFVQMRARSIAPPAIIDLKHIPGFTAISFDNEAGLEIGAAATMNSVAAHPKVRQHYPLLVEALESVASYQLRNRATIGGNLCNASPAADSAPPLLVLEAELSLRGGEGERKLKLGDFFLGPGETALKPGELLTGVQAPIQPSGWRGRYLKLGRNTSGDLAIVGVAVLGYPDKAAASGYSFRISLASVAPTPIRVSEAEMELSRNDPSQNAFIKAAKIAQDLATPISDARASAQYRSAMVYELTLWGLSDVWRMLEEG